MKMEQTREINHLKSSLTLLLLYGGILTRKVPRPGFTVAQTKRDTPPPFSQRALFLCFQETQKAKLFLPFLQRAGRSEAVVEYVFSGSRLKLYLPKETCLITFLLAGRSHDQRSRLCGHFLPDQSLEPRRSTDGCPPTLFQNALTGV